MTKADCFQKILNEFVATPKSNSKPTFMDICQMSGDRFEERCSQILKFFLSPDAPHRLKGLLISSFLEVLGRTDLIYSCNSVKVRTEEMTQDGKYIDITVIADNFVIAIENKIGASLYNPLESYVSYIEEAYNHISDKIYLVLSVRSLTDESEIRKIKKYGYEYLNYEELFKVIKRNLGNYALDADQAYLTFLLDFIRTIENRYYNNNMELKRFFYNNRKQIDWLIAEYNTFKNDIMRLRKEQIASLKVRICDRTNAGWWVFQGWDLGIKFNDNGNCLGIESEFRNGTLDDPIGDFCIYITVWQKRHFRPYEQILKSTYPNCSIDYESDGGSRVKLHLPPIKGNETDKIVDSLAECYDTVKRITDKIK